MNLSFTTEYYPDLEELTEDQVVSSREKVVAALQTVMPDVDLAPGTPTGDLVVSPLATFRAAAEVANSRLMSDLDLANVADGLIYSCDFVRAYLGNFAVYDVENFKATGLVRLTFTSGTARTIPRTVRFQFNTGDDWSLRMSNPEGSEIQLLSAGSSNPGEPDTYVLVQTSAASWSVDLPLEGVLSAPVSQGTAGTINEAQDDLIGITAATSFLSGLPSSSLYDLAKMARKTAFSLTAGSRASTKSLVYRHWPETAMVSPVVPGDAEMQRTAAGSAIALNPPAVDLYVRSTRDMQRETQTVRLDYVQPTVGGDKVFRGAIPLLHRASRIIDIQWSGTAAGEEVASYQVYSRSARGDLYGSLHCGSRFEELSVELVPEVDGSDIPYIPLTDEVGPPAKQYAMFTVTYDCDPLLETISNLLESPEYRPAGVDVLVKSGPLSLIEGLTITYTKKEGVKTVLSAARTAIVEYVRQAGHPDVFRTTAIHDIMRDAGVERVTKVEAVGRVFVSAADRLFRNAITDPGDTDELEDWLTESDPFRVLTTVTAEGVVPYQIIDGEISPGGPPDAWAATSRTCRYYVDADNVNFVEV